MNDLVTHAALADDTLVKGQILNRRLITNSRNRTRKLFYDRTHSQRVYQKYNESSEKIRDPLNATIAFRVGEQKKQTNGDEKNNTNRSKHSCFLKQGKTNG